MRCTTIAIAAAVAAVSSLPRDAAADDADAAGWFERRDGIRQSFAPTYDAWFGPDRDEERPGQAAVTILGLMGIGLLYYWSDPLANREDWDHPSLEDRYTLRALRFDTNLNSTNHLLHPTAGGLVYAAARFNGMGVLPSFGFGVAQTVVWELGLEWREKSSVNDLFYTAVGGAAIGEFINRATDYFTSAPGGGGFAQRTAAWTLGLPRSLHTMVTPRNMPPVPLPTDELGFSSAYGHDFGLRYELASLWNDAGDTGAMHRVRIDAAFAAMPGFLRPGRFDTSFGEGNFTELSLRLGFSGNDGSETDLLVRSTLAGRYAQDLTRDDRGGLWGRAVIWGVGPAVRFQESTWLGRPDQLSAVHLFGPQLDTFLAFGSVLASIGAEVYPDFGSIRSLAFEDLVNREGTKSVLQRQGYAYSFGAWARARTSIVYGPLSLAGSFAYGTYESIEGLDRFQERVTRDLHGHDDVLEMEAALSVRAFDVLTVEAGARERRRSSRLGDLGVRRWDRDVHVAVGLVF